MRTLYLVSYDIADPRRLHRVARACEDFGKRLQKSVFECALTQTDLVLLRARLQEEIEPDEDQVLFVRLGPADAGMTERFESLGRKYAPSIQTTIIA